MLRSEQLRIILVIVCLLSGSVLLIYSQTRVGMSSSAQYWWASGGGYSGYQTFLVNETHPTARANYNGPRLNLDSFDTGNATISIDVICDMNGTILSLTNVSGEEIPRFTFSSGDAQTSVDQIFTVSIYRESEDANVSFYYDIDARLHNHIPTYFELPGYQESLMGGIILVCSGIVVLGIHHSKRND